MANEVKMLKSTRQFIGALLAAEVEVRKNRMLDCINNEFPNTAERMKQYQEAYKVEQDFFEWDDEQEG